jgi:hypothetical protein
VETKAGWQEKIIRYKKKELEMREKILLAGDSNTSKTMSLVSLALLNPNRKVYLFDPDDGTRKLMAEFGLTAELVPNLVIFPVRSDWKAFIDNYTLVKSIAHPEDWICFDMLGRFWDLAQQYYSNVVFGVDPIDHLMNLKKQAQAVNFGGFDGLQDWALIKRLHNEKVLDDAVIYSDFNVMATTSVAQYLPVEKVPTVGIASIYAQEFRVKPEGEKHNIYRFDTQAMMYRKPTGTYHFRLVRDRGRATDVKQEFDITNKSFWEVYTGFRGINP